MSLWSCLLFSCTPSPTTTSPSPDPRQVSTPPTRSPQREGLKQGQWRKAGPSSTHPTPPLPVPSAAPETDVPVDTNLIEFDTNYATDDDIVFEDFARLRLKGMKDDDYDDQLC
ncbi:hypothetical protein P7K49_011294 [Saguinus oedipus]|uniref:Uncharacterized protein n=1 Tax=Saguinus oedipus TaxID=9490 RepID=A0ABQ9VSK8_SAGOE|nr:hypothetical protein P7K49_011294 [Saguinus oedipus]